MKQHFCSTSDGVNIVCFCIRGEDHGEAEFDVPVTAPSPDKESNE